MQHDGITISLKFILFPVVIDGHVFNIYCYKTNQNDNYKTLKNRVPVMRPVTLVKFSKLDASDDWSKTTRYVTSRLPRVSSMAGVMRYRPKGEATVPPSCVRMRNIVKNWRSEGLSSVNQEDETN